MPLYWLINLFFLILGLKFLADLILVVWCNFKYKVPYVPTKNKLIKKTLDEIKLKRGMKVVELGSGDGRVLVEFAKRFEIEAVGYERNTWLLQLSKLRWLVTWPKRGKIRFENKDLFEIDLKGVDIVYIYLLPWMIEKLRPKFEMEMKKGALVISVNYPVSSQKFKLVKTISGSGQKIRVYKHL